MDIKLEKMKHLLSSSLIMFSLLLGTQVNAECLFNGELRDCRGVTGRGRTPLSKGSDLDILWGDGEVTTIKYVPMSGGQENVLINGNTHGVRTYNRTLRPGIFELGFKSSTGNIFAITIGD